MKNLKITILGIVALMCLNSMQAQDEVSQREVIVLLELKAKTKGHLWTNQWDVNKPIATWHGVTVKNGKVVGLDLSNNNLQGRLPITIGNLKNLEILNLSGNKIEGKIPRLFRKFAALQEFNLANNQLEGNIPTTINELHSLRQLMLGNNKLEGSLPASINELTNLNILGLANNALEGTLPDGMEQLKKLKRLYLSNTQLSNLDALRTLANQQLVLTDFYIEKGEILPLSFKDAPQGLSKLQFEN